PHHNRPHTNPIQYGGEYTNPDHTQYTPARTYNTDGHWTTRDTYQLHNRYNAFDADPINHTDPSGHMKIGIGAQRAKAKSTKGWVDGHAPGPANDLSKVLGPPAADIDAAQPRATRGDIIRSYGATTKIPEHFPSACISGKKCVKLASNDKLYEPNVKKLPSGPLHMSFSTKPLYRGDTRHPKDVFKNGFQAKNVNNPVSLWGFINHWDKYNDTPWVSLTRSEKYAQQRIATYGPDTGHADSMWVYEIASAQGIINPFKSNATSKMTLEFESEMTALAGIDPRDISRAYRLKIPEGGTYTDAVKVEELVNPGYTGRGVKKINKHYPGLANMNY
ncbi:hypothetical protein AB0D08_39620, partial [Kitasatospora sp. NPDC048540]|uniref:scabin-related ADP-ribosyltransferase n=1 Tax=Kitasatospora sp. NPDC048540 TaxID=3155634 RepID=UPI0033F191DD